MDLITLIQSKKYTDTSILGTTGPLKGKSAYEIAQINGFIGSEQAWLASLRGESGENPEFRTQGNVLQYRLPISAPTWVDLYTYENNAINVAFDNTVSGLSSTNTLDAINEIVIKIEEIKGQNGWVDY